VKAKRHVTCPSGKRRAVRVHAGTTVLLEVGSGTVAVQRDGEPDTSPGDGLTPLFGARCLSTGLLHFGRRHREVITAVRSLTRYHPSCHCAGIAGRGRPFLRISACNHDRALVLDGGRLVGSCRRSTWSEWWRRPTGVGGGPVSATSAPRPWQPAAPCGRASRVRRWRGGRATATAPSSPTRSRRPRLAASAGVLGQARDGNQAADRPGERAPGGPS
jgi:hypothetical protein